MGKSNSLISVTADTLLLWMLATLMVDQGVAITYSRRTAVRGNVRRLGAGSWETSKGKGKGKGKGQSEDNGDYDDGSYEEDQDNLFDHNKRTEISTEEGFVALCRSSLLSFGSASDGLISQIDAAEFIWDVCDIFDHEDIPEFQCPTPQFSNLDIEVQLSFVWYICPNDEQVDTLNCLGNLGLQQAEFGYSITAENYQTSADSITGFCCSLLPFLERTGITPLSSSICPDDLPDFDLGLDTPAPLPDPTRRPTKFPTGSPTSQPTSPPMSSPTPRPTPQPTPPPTMVPTQPDRGEENPGGDVGTGSSPSAALTTEPTLTPTSSPSSSRGQPVILVQGSGGNQTESQANTLSVGGTVGIVLGSAAVLIVSAVLFTRRRRKAEDYA